MELSSMPLPALIKDSELEFSAVIGSGGFGQIYKAKHTKLVTNVAVKILHVDNSKSSLMREAILMQQGNNSNVLRILGMYEGHPPGVSSIQLGLVMELMERGSLKSLLEIQRPPWPLVCRLAHQIAQGMNFLHCLTKPLLHMDLKPSNVLLDDSLNAKITDFGLAKVSRSVSKVNQEKDGEDGGTTIYMPPEALQSLDYKPTPAYDVYSYGIVLWSTATGREPYADAKSSVVRLRIPKGDRPDLSLVCEQAQGVKELTGLMEKCWHAVVENRPTFRACLTVTEMLYELHKRKVNDAVHDVLKKMDSSDEDHGMNSAFESLNIFSQASNGLHKTRVESNPVQEAMSDSTSSLRKEHTLALPVASKSVGSAKGTTSQKQAPFPCFTNQTPPRDTRSYKTQRQLSNPSHGVTITGTNMSYVQIGNNNVMHVDGSPRRERRRNPTAPSSVTVPNKWPEDLHKKP